MDQILIENKPLCSVRKKCCSLPLALSKEISKEVDQSHRADHPRQYTVDLKMEIHPKTHRVVLKTEMERFYEKLARDLVRN